MAGASRVEGRKQRLWTRAWLDGTGEDSGGGGGVCDIKKQLPEEVSPDRLDTPALERQRKKSC